MLADASQRNQAILALMRYAGLRIAEVSGLDLADVDLQVETVRIVGKGNKERVLPIVEALGAYLGNWIAERGQEPGPLFLGIHGERLGPKGIRVALKKLARKVGVAKFTPHRIRHTFGTETSRAGVPVEVLQQLMGHESIETTMLYRQVTAQDLRQAQSLIQAYERSRDYRTGAGKPTGEAVPEKPEELRK
jgi:integrase/recombinase XerC